MRPWVWIALLMTAAAAASVFLADNDVFGPLPEPLPIHWNIEGKADGWAPRSQAFWWMMIAPAVMLGMILMGLVLPWLSPKQFSIDNFRATYEHIMLLLVVLFGCIHVVLLLSYLKKDIDGARWMVGGMMVFFAVLGNVMGKVRRNFYVGVRTPWTIASDAVWNRTHRVAAWLWTPGGLILGIAVLCGLPLLWSLAPFFVMVLFPVFYSLYYYKKLERQGKLDIPSEPGGNELSTQPGVSGTN